MKLLDNKKLYKYIADNGHALVEKKYSWTTSMNKLDDIITKIVENKKSQMLLQYNLLILYISNNK